MDDIDFVGNIQSVQTNHANELSELDHDIAWVGRSLSLKLIQKKLDIIVEQRAYERFKVHKDAFALIRPATAEQLRVEDKSMAEIACDVYRSKPVRFGRINTISMGGLSLRYITGEEQSNQPLVLDILVAESGYYLENLTFKNISDVEIDENFEINSFKMRLNRLQFGAMRPAAVLKLEHFIKNYCVYGG